MALLHRLSQKGAQMARPDSIYLLSHKGGQRLKKTIHGQSLAKTVSNPWGKLGFPS